MTKAFFILSMFIFRYIETELNWYLDEESVITEMKTKDFFNRNNYRMLNYIIKIPTEKIEFM